MDARISPSDCTNLLVASRLGSASGLTLQNLFLGFQTCKRSTLAWTDPDHISVLCAFCFKWESRRLCGVRSPLCLVHWLNTLKFVERRGAPPQNHELGSNQACSPLCAVHLLNTLTFVERRGASPQNHELGSNQVRAQCFSHSSIVSHHSSANVSLDFSSDQKIFTRALLQLGSWMKLQRLEWWAVEAGVS